MSVETVYPIVQWGCEGVWARSIVPFRTSCHLPAALNFSGSVKILTVHSTLSIRDGISVKGSVLLCGLQHDLQIGEPTNLRTCICLAGVNSNLKPLPHVSYFQPPILIGAPYLQLKRDLLLKGENGQLHFQHLGCWVSASNGRAVDTSVAASSEASSSIFHQLGRRRTLANRCLGEMEFQSSWLAPALSLAIFGSRLAHAISTITAAGSKFFDEDGNQFYLKGAMKLLL